MSTFCPCGSGTLFSDCCEPLHLGASASGPEALMRSRFSAFATSNLTYLNKSWAAKTRPADLTLDPEINWVRLQIISSSKHGQQGQVHFRAFYKDKSGSPGMLEEHSRFIKKGADWYYLDGETSFTTLS